MLTCSWQQPVARGGTAGSGAVEFRILGPLEVVVGDRRIDLGPPQQRALLALLLINVNRVLTTDRILEELWGEEAEGKANTLWVYVSRLRTILEPDRVGRGQSSTLVTRDHGYALTIDAGAVDATVFETRAAEGRALLKDDPRAASDVLKVALRLWRGAPLQDFAYEQFAQAEIARLEEARLSAVEDRIDGDLRLGRSGELIGELEAFCRQHPLRERGVRQLMLALYRSGRHAESLRAFERFRRYLADELGLEPSPALRRLEEQVLLHDPGLEVRSVGGDHVAAVGEVANPFRGLRAFGERDAAVFFGRDRLVADALRRISDGTRLVALVGPSGSGKSSVLKAGIIPVLRKEGLRGDDPWLVAQMVPGAHPFAEFDAALRHASLDGPDSPHQALGGTSDSLLRAVLGVLRDDNSRLLLAIDQFEELFSLVDDDVRRRFVEQLVMLLDDPHGRIVVVLTLRADFYSHLLAHPAFGAMLGDGVVNVVPLRPDELESAAQQPATHAGLHVESALLAKLLTDVLGQPGSLPLFQYALTEVFERRQGDRLTLEMYRALGGIDGAVTTRAEELYEQLDEEQRSMTRQLFLRLVVIGEDDAWGRRRMVAAELTSLDMNIVALHDVIERYAGHRLITLDRDPVTGSPTVEVAHEALLREWGRLRRWIDDARQDVRLHTALSSAAKEWRAAGRSPDYLLVGSRLERYEGWATTARLALTAEERAYLDASARDRERIETAEARRLETEARLARTARRRLWALATVVLAVTAAAALIVALGPHPARVASIAPTVTEEVEGLMRTGFARAARELDVEVEHLRGPFSDLEEQYRQLVAAETNLVFLDPDSSGQTWVDDLIANHPDTAFALIDGDRPAPGVRAIYFADEQGGYLAGAAAALTTRTGVVGFVGAEQTETSERWRGGYEAGVHAIDPDVNVRALYIGVGRGGLANADEGRAAATQLYTAGADVVLSVAADATSGVIRAAWEQTEESGIRRWVIGSESDWALERRLYRTYVLTSVIRQWDIAVFDTVRAYVDGTFAPGIVVLTASDGAVALTQSPYLSQDDRQRIAQLSLDTDGEAAIPHAPVGTLAPPSGVDVSETVTVVWDGRRCSYEGSAMTYPAGTVLRLHFVNTSGAYYGFSVHHTRREVELGTLARPNASTTGYVTLHPGHTEVHCLPDTRIRPTATPATAAILRTNDPRPEPSPET